MTQFPLLLPSFTLAENPEGSDLTGKGFLGAFALE
jgi:hypothetical protein